MIVVTAALSRPCGYRNLRVAIRSGRNFRVDSPPFNALVTPELAHELQQVLDRFGRDVTTGANRVGVFFRPGIFGHHKVGRAADIYGVGGVGLDVWKRRWDEARQRVARANSAFEGRAILDKEGQNNLGWRLYKTLQNCGRWSQPYGFPIQLFGPWTREEGPWKYISNFLLNAHRDHIHVAK
ncbi:MAG TPA: hypothetical protein VF074_01395 [Pyrinomonadaceae bacterium]